MLERICTHDIGPAAQMSIDTGEGMTLLTGMNGLGRTLLLDAAWRARTGQWPCEANPEIRTGRPARAAAGAATAAAEATERELRGEARIQEARWRTDGRVWLGPTRRTKRALIYAHGNGATSAWIGTPRNDRPTRRVTLADGTITSAEPGGRGRARLLRPTRRPRRRAPGARAVATARSAEAGRRRRRIEDFDGKPYGRRHNWLRAGRCQTR